MSEKILLIAPHPFYQERGTPIAVEFLIKALTKKGFQIDLLTFNEGIDVNYPGLNIHRVKPFPQISNVRPGFSGKKILLDILVFFKFNSLMFKTRYKVVHAVEESAFMAFLICPLFKTPYIYDMDSSMATQIIDKMNFLKPVEKFIRAIESIPMKYANLVIPVCQALADEVLKYRSTGVEILKDVSLATNDPENNKDLIKIRSQFRITGKILMYIGNLESYQGIDLMIDSYAHYFQSFPDSRLVIIGGENVDILKYQEKCKNQNIQDSVIFMGKQPISQISGFMTQADILVSPRIHGVNTPMKVYSYLDSGVVVLATNLPTHTQVADESQAYLAEPEPLSFSKGMIELSNNKELCIQLASNAKNLIKREHSYEAFQTRLYEIYDLLDQQ